MAQVDERRASILASLKDRNLLTPALEKAINAANTVTTLEDIYLPFRPKKRTRATIAKEKGLEPLADLIFAQDDATAPLAAAQIYVGREYTADDAQRMGMVNAVAAHDELEDTALQWAKEINSKSPTAQRMLKFSFNLIDDGLVGQQVFAGEATRLAYMTDEAQEGRTSFLDKRDPDWSAFPWLF
jgi:naphthoate synthase